MRQATGTGSRGTAGGRFLFVTWPGGGNVHPLVALATQLEERGHEPRVLGEEVLRERFVRAGIEFVAHRSAEEWTGGDPIAWPTPPTPEQQRATFAGFAADVIAELARHPVDVAVVDYMQPEALSAVESAGVPVVAFVHTLHARVAVGPWTPMEISGGLPAVNHLRADLGLPEVAGLTQLLDAAELVLVLTVAELDRPDGPVPPNVRYVGPVMEAAGSHASWEPPWPPGDRPLVHACNSTLAGAEEGAVALQRVLDATADLPVHLVVTAPKEVQDALRVPANAAVTGFVRHRALLPHVDLFVTHAGLGSLSAGLAWGVPMVCVPVEHDQPANADHAVTLGVARKAPEGASVAELREVIAEALADEAMGAAAERMAGVVAAHAGRPVAELEDLLARVRAGHVAR
jgi:UDP:flavonoid glycosyltransferase YjiC (YdhE family)